MEWRGSECLQYTVSAKDNFHVQAGLHGCPPPPILKGLSHKKVEIAMLMKSLASTRNYTTWNLRIFIDLFVFLNSNISSRGRRQNMVALALALANVWKSSRLLAASRKVHLCRLTPCRTSVCFWNQGGRQPLANWHSTLIKTKTKLSSYIRKSWRERLQSHIWLTASSIYD